MTIWFSKKINGKKQYCSKSISFRYHPQHWRLIQWKNNGALKGRKEDTCYDLNIHFLGIFFEYTNWDYNILNTFNIKPLSRKEFIIKIFNNGE